MALLSDCHRRTKVICKCVGARRALNKIVYNMYIYIHVRWVCIIVTMTGRTDNNNFATLSDISFTAFHYLIYFCCCLFFVCFRIFIQISHTPQSGSLDCIRYTIFRSRFLHRDCRECLRLQSPLFFVVVVVGVEHICGAGNNKYVFLE